ncbi:MAG: hypothetical protein KDE27_06870 [Planctomycetes bacterium]|nr:hypothetical protein [Planctomycetota bacterium]
MEKHLGTIVAVLFGSLAWAQDRPDPVLERVGKHFRIEFHHGDLSDDVAAALADPALATVEGFWPVLQKMVGARGGEVLTIRLYRDAQSFLEIEHRENQVAAELTGFVSKAREAYVKLTPELAPALFAHTGLPGSTVQDLLWVAADLVIEPLVPRGDTDDWMRWLLVIGAIEQATNPKRDYGVDPYFDSRRGGFVRAAPERRYRLLDLQMPPLDKAGGDNWQWSIGCLAVLSQLLESADRRWARKVLKAKFRMIDGHDATGHWRYSAISAVLGGNPGKNGERLDELFAGMTCEWQIRGPLCQRDGKRLLLAGGGDRRAAIDAARPLPAGDFFIAGRFELGPGSDRPLRIVFGRDEGGNVAVDVDEKKAWIGTWSQADEKWIRRAEAERSQPGSGPTEVRIEVVGPTLRVLLDGTEACSWLHDGRELRGRAALEVFERIVWVEDLRFGPLQ